MVNSRSERVSQMESGTIRPREQILEQALALNPEDRAFLADEIERSLPPSAFASDEIAAVWSDEIDRRIAAYEHGEATVVSLDAVVDNARQALAVRRSQRMIETSKRCSYSRGK